MALSGKLSTLNSQLSTVIVADRGTVRLNPDAFITDVAEFDASLKAAASTNESHEQTQWLAPDNFDGPPAHFLRTVGFGRGI